MICRRPAAAIKFVLIALLLVVSVTVSVSIAGDAARLPASNEVDTALVLAVDVSDSVDAERYKLQMEGIAQALESENVIASITSGPKGGIILALVLWSNSAELSLPWTIIRSPEDALAFAASVRAIQQKPGNFLALAA